MQFFCLFFFFGFFVLFGQPGLCLWSRTMRGSDAAQSDFLTFFLKCANCKKKVRKYTDSIEKVWLNVFLHEGEEKENK